MDDDTDLGESLVSNLDHSPNSTSSLSKSDVLSGTQMIDNWCKCTFRSLFSSITFKYSLCYNLDLDISIMILLETNYIFNIFWKFAFSYLIFSGFKCTLYNFY